jgi:flagellar assembly protein FliH
LHVQPERVLPLIEAALEALPSMRQPGEVKLHPQDLERARAALTEEMRAVGWRCIADDRVEPGACLVETASNSVDATLATRWQRLQEGLGLLPQPWLDG